jgi:8-oxo-dGTP diphosphatase
MLCCKFSDLLIGGTPAGVRVAALFQPVSERVEKEASHGGPRIPASAGALIFDRRGGLLILKPTYKKGWTVPGGQVEQGGESPWDACRRETLEECGLRIDHGRLACVDFLSPRPNKPGGMRFLFDCGSWSDEQLAAIRLQVDEIAEHRFVAVADAIGLLSGPVGRRVSEAAGSDRCVYLENGRRVDGVV